MYTAIHNPAVGLHGVLTIVRGVFMETKSVGIREFRAGLAEFIDSKQSVAVTRHGQTVGFFIPTARLSQADLQALRNAIEKRQAIMSLSEDDVDAAVRDFEVLRKGASARRRSRT